MSGMIVAAGIGAGATVYAANKSGGGGGKMNMWEEMALQYFPEQYEVEPAYTESQDYLKNLGTDILEGDIPDYYKPIGEFGGDMFEDMITSARGDITDQVYSDTATRNVGRGGIPLMSQINAMNKVLPQLRYQDYSRAIEGRGKLFGAGTDILEGVRTSAYNLGQGKNQFALNRFNTLMGAGGNQAQLDLQQDQGEASMWGDLAGGAANFYLTNKYLNTLKKKPGAAGGGPSGFVPQANPIQGVLY